MIKRFSDNAMIVSGGVGNVKGVKEFDSGKRVGEFGVAGDYKDGATVWCNVKAWGFLADVAGRVRKGDQVIVTGRYEEKPGNDGKIFKACVADAIVGAAMAGEAYDTPNDEAEIRAQMGVGEDDGTLPF